MMTDRPNKWLGYRELVRLMHGEVPGMTTVDVRATVEGQAESKMRGYAQKVKWWDVRPEENSRKEF